MSLVKLEFVVVDCWRGNYVAGARLLSLIDNSRKESELLGKEMNPSSKIKATHHAAISTAHSHSHISQV
jgi:hypothetical protein